MKVLLFGSTGMIGQGVLREALADPAVASVVAIGRSKSSTEHPKLQQITLPDPSDLSTVDGLADFDACLFCAGVSSAGMSEADYTKVTYDFTVRVAETLVAKNPRLVFIYVSGAGTDSTERGRSMWARVKGRTENTVLALPFERAYMARPGYIQPEGGITSRTGLYRAAYAVTGPLYPLLRRLAPGSVMTLGELSRAMIAAAKHGAPKQVLEVTDLRALDPHGAAKRDAAEP